MKTEQQIEQRLDEIVKKIESITFDVGDDEPTEEQKSSLGVLVSQMFAIGWVMDCEDDLKQIARTFKIAAAVEIADKGVKPRSKKKDK